MNINKKLDGGKLIIEIEGRVDTSTAPQLEVEIRKSLEGINELVFDFPNLQYISYAGLRVLLLAQKIINKQGNLTVKNANQTIKEVFDVTGFADVLNVE